MTNYHLGIDLGGTNIAAGVVDDEGNLLSKVQNPTNRVRSYSEIAVDMIKTGEAAANKLALSLSDFSEIGIGTPGRETNGNIRYSNSLCWENVPLRDSLQQYYSGRVRIRNDGECALVGEVLFGGAKGYKNVVMVTLGTGVGSSVLLDGKIFAGGDSFGSELGHASINPKGRLCSCGKRGCMEAHSSATALKAITIEAAKMNHCSEIWKICEGNLEKIDGQTAFLARERGDSTATEVVEEYIDYLGYGLSAFATIFRPEIILLGGGISNEGVWLMERLNELVKKLTYSAKQIGAPRVAMASLGNNAGIIGAALQHKI